MGMRDFPRSMSSFLAALALGLAAMPCAAQERAAGVAAELDPQRLELAGEIIDIAYPPQGRRELLLDAIDAMMAQIRTAAASSGRPPDAGAERIVERYLKRVRAAGEKAVDEHIPALFGAYARAYARGFTAAELTEIRAFVGTPTGAKYVRRSPQLLSDPDVARANSAYIATAMAATGPLQAELHQELSDYFRKAGTRK